jgi:hypothetical protein
MNRLFLFGLVALVLATFSLNAQNKVAFVGVYDNISDLQLDDEDVYDAAVWCVNTYGGEYLPVSQITPAKLSEYTALWIYYDNDYLAAAPSEIADDPTVLATITNWYKAGGNLLLGTYGNFLLGSFGRVANTSLTITGTGTGAANPDRWDLGTSYGTWEAAPLFIDRFTDPLYDGLETAQVLRPNGQEYPVIPLNDGGWKEDHNCFWDMSQAGLGYGNGDSENITVFESTYSCNLLGTWGHVADYCGAGLVRWLPQGDFQGKAIAIGLAAYEWHTNSGAANQYLGNIKKLTENALNELSGNTTGITTTLHNANVTVNINNGILKIGGENIASVKIYSVNGALAGSSVTPEINVSNLSKGVYIVRWADSKGNTASAKFVK